MGLMIPTPGQSKWQDDLVATPSLSASGITVTSSGTINVKGAYTTLFASVPFDVTGITICPLNNTDSGAVRNMLLDLGIGAAASEVVIAANLMLSQANSFVTATPICFLPIRIAKGQRLSARVQSSVATKTINLMVWLHGGGDGECWPSFDNCETIGADIATSKGVEHVFGSTGTYSTWANIGSVSAKQFKAITPVMQQGSDTTMTNLVGYLEVGIASVAFAKYLFTTGNIEGPAQIIPNIPLYKRFPAGTQFMIRGTCHTTADDNLGVGLVGFY